MIINSNTLVYEHPQDDPIENAQGSSCVEIRGLEPGYLYYAKTTITNDMNLTATTSLYSFYTLPNSYVIAEVIDHETIKCIIEVNTTHVDFTTVGLMYKKASEPDWVEITSQQQVIMLENLEPTTVYYIKSFVIDTFGRRSDASDFIDVITPNAPVSINIDPSTTTIDFNTLSPVELFTNSEITNNVQTNNGCITTVSFTPAVLNRNYLVVDSVSIVVATLNDSVLNEYTSSDTNLQYTNSFSLLPGMELNIYGKVSYRIDGDPSNTLYEYNTEVVEVETYSQLQFIDYTIVNNLANVSFDIIGNYQQIFLEYNNNNWIPIGYNHQTMTCKFPVIQGINTIRGRVLNNAGMSEYTTLRIVN